MMVGLKPGDSIAGTGAEPHKPWRDRGFELPYMALYGAQKVAKTKLALQQTEVIDRTAP
jgi:hypothetical protein